MEYEKGVIFAKAYKTGTGILRNRTNGIPDSMQVIKIKR